MASKQLRWCCNQRNGINLVEPNRNLSLAFIEKSERSIEEMSNAKYQESKLHFAYYAMYESFYAIMQRVGVKCEIHTCTFEFMKSFLTESFSKDECSFLEKAYTARKDATYYVNRKISDQTTIEIIKKAPLFVVKCKSVLEKINENKIKSVRDALKKIC